MPPKKKPDPAPQAEYKLTIAKIISLLTVRDRGDVVFYNRVAKQPMPRYGRNTFKNWVGFPSEGSINHFLRRWAEFTNGGKWIWLDDTFFVGIWTFLTLIEDKNGKGLVDPEDPQRREIRPEMWTELLELHIATAPDPLSHLTPEMARQMLRLSGTITELEAIYEAVPSSPSTLILKRTLGLYRVDHDLDSWDDAAEKMASSLELEEGDRAQMVKHLVSAIASIQKGNLPEYEVFELSMPVFAKNLTGIDGEAFENVEALLTYARLLDSDWRTGSAATNSDRANGKALR